MREKDFAVRLLPHPRSSPGQVPPEIPLQEVRDYAVIASSQMASSLPQQQRKRLRDCWRQVCQAAQGKEKGKRPMWLLLVWYAR